VCCRQPPEAAPPAALLERNPLRFDHPTVVIPVLDLLDPGIWYRFTEMAGSSLGHDE